MLQVMPLLLLRWVKAHPRYLLLSWPGNLLYWWRQNPLGSKAAPEWAHEDGAAASLPANTPLALELMADPSESCSGWPGALWGQHHCPQVHQSTCVLLTPWEELTHSLWDSIQCYGDTSETLNNILQQPHWKVWVHLPSVTNQTKAGIMELQGHILIPEFYSSALISPHVYKWCKTSTVVSLIQNKLLFYGKNYTSYLHRQPIFSKQELKLKLTTKISKTEKLLQFKLFQEKWTHNTYYKSDLCGGLQLVPSWTSLTQLLGNLLSLSHDLRSHMGKLTLKYLQFMCCSWK